MKIKNLDKYVTNLIGTNTDVSKLGTNEEPLYTHFRGKVEELHSFLTEFSSFAASPCEQFYYEYIQNAYDSGADRVLFLLNEKYLLIINNGKQFYTGNEFNNPNIKGHFHRFLALHSSKHPNDKSGKKGDIGKYGQGSKLIYTLLSDNDTHVDSEAAIQNAIINQGKAPFLISWSNQTQLYSLLQGLDTDYNIVDPENNDSIIFSKIVMGYYPLHPGICEKFTKDEALNVLSIVKPMIPQDQLCYLSQGTAILVPLGEGKYQQLTEHENIEKVKNNAAIFLSIYKSYLSEDHKLTQVIINDKKIDQTLNCVTIPMSIKWGEEDIDVAISFGLQYCKGVNLFKGLPIVNSKLGLGFVIDSSRFETDKARQNLLDKNKSKNLINAIFEKTIEEIKRLNKQSIQKVIDALLHSEIVQCHADIDNHYITEPFMEYFLPLVKDMVPTIEGNNESIKNVWFKATELFIVPSSLGIKKQYISADTKDLLFKNHNLTVDTASLSQMLEVASEQSLRNYILDLNNQDYERFVNTCQNEKISSGIKIYRTNIGNVFSKDELFSPNNNVLFYTDNEMRRLEEYSGLEHVIIPFNNENIRLFEKVERNIQMFQNDRCNNLACYVFYKAETQNPNYRNQVQSVALLKSKDGEYLPFSDLFYEYNGKTIVSSKVVSKPIPYHASKEWFRQDWKSWVRNNYDIINQLPDWKDCHSSYIKEIQEAYEGFNYNRNGNLRNVLFPLYLDENLVPTSSEQYKLDNASVLSDEEYRTIVSLFPQYSLLPVAYRKELSEKPFLSSVNSRAIKEMIADGNEYSFEQVRLFFKLDKNLLNRFIVTNGSGKFVFKHKGNSFNVISDSSLSEEQRAIFEEVGGVFIPKEIEALLTDNTKHDFSPRIWKDSSPLQRAVSDANDAKPLFSIVKRLGDEAINELLRKIEIDIDDNIAESDIRWEIINHSIRNEQFIDLTRKCISINGDRLPQNITEQFITCNGQPHNIYDLIDEIKEDNEIIERLGRYLSKQMRDSFVEAFYRDPVRLTTEKVYDRLETDCLTLSQFSFCMDYAYENNLDNEDFSLADESEIKDALQIVKERDYKGFDRYFSIPGFNKNVQVYAPEELLLEEEVLSPVVYEWIKNDKNNLSLFSSLKSEKKTSLIKLRRAVLDNMDWDCHNDIRKELEDNDLVNRTSEWLLSVKEFATKQNKSFDAIQTYADKLSEIEEIVLLQLTTDSNNDPIYRLVQMSDADGYYIYEDEARQILELMKKSVGTQIQSLLEDECLMILPSKEFAGRHSIGEESIIQIEKAPAKDKTAREWDDKVYKKWTKESGIQIFITPQNVSTSVVFKTSDKTIKTIGFKDGADGFKKNEMIILKDPSPKKVSQSLTDICNRMGDDYKWFHQPFIQYLSMALNGVEEESEDTTTASTDQGYPTNHGISYGPSVGHGSGNLNVKEENKDILKALDEWEHDLLDWMKDNKDEIEHLKKNPDSQIRKISGYLGEQLYYQYMRKLGIKVEDITEEGFADFQKEDGSVDVKTNIGSMRSEPKPIHLHKETQRYLNENPQNQLFIFHISLADVGIESDYRELERRYGKYADPRLDDKLRKECDDLAVKYWKKKNVDDFRDETCEYLLKTPGVTPFHPEG